MLLLAVVAGLWSCYDDKGNYDYKNLISLQIDTLGIKAEQTAYQFENFNVRVMRKICLTNGKYIRRTLKKMMMCRNMTPPWFYTRKQFSIRSYMKFRVPII